MKTEIKCHSVKEKEMRRENRKWGKEKE